MSERNRESVAQSESGTDDKLEDVYVQLTGLHMSIDIEGRSKHDDRLLYIAEQIHDQADRVRGVREDLRELADKWEEYGEAPDEACASELRTVLEYRGEDNDE